MDDTFWDNLPPEIEVAEYRSVYPDLSGFSDEQLEDHYRHHGRNEGRRANCVLDRNGFAGLIPETASVLEIGPFFSPVARGRLVSYLDVLSREQLIGRAKEIGLDPSGVPEIDYVSPAGDLSIVDRAFDFVISSHSIEHQPDLVHHLQQVHRVLAPGGGYFVLIPDKRYCFDHFIPESNLAEVILAHRERRKQHLLRSVIEHRALTTHNESDRHWRGHGVKFEHLKDRASSALREFETAKGGYIDVHAWYFTPQSCADIISGLSKLGLSEFRVHRVYPSRWGSGEFWMILRAV